MLKTKPCYEVSDTIEGINYLDQYTCTPLASNHPKINIFYFPHQREKTRVKNKPKPCHWDLFVLLNVLLYFKFEWKWNIVTCDENIFFVTRMAPRRSCHRYCSTSFNVVWRHFLRRFKHWSGRDKALMGTSDTGHGSNWIEA